MHPLQIESRCPSVEFFSKGELNNFILNFPIYDKKWKAGVASITAKEGNTVEGVIYEISKADLNELDFIEDIESGDYYRNKVNIQLPNGNFIKVWTYLSSKNGNYPPANEYINKVINGAIYHKLSDLYILELKKRRV